MYGDFTVSFQGNFAQENEQHFPLGIFLCSESGRAERAIQTQKRIFEWFIQGQLIYIYILFHRPTFVSVMKNFQELHKLCWAREQAIRPQLIIFNHTTVDTTELLLEIEFGTKLVPITFNNVKCNLGQNISLLNSLSNQIPRMQNHVHLMGFNTVKGISKIELMQIAFHFPTTRITYYK